jgi:hypothetical protein
MGISYLVLYQIKYWNNGQTISILSFIYNRTLPITEDDLELVKRKAFEDFRKGFDPTNDLDLKYDSDEIKILAFSRFGG